MRRFAFSACLCLTLPFTAGAQTLSQDQANTVLLEALAGFGCSISREDGDLFFGFMMGWAAQSQGFTLDGVGGPDFDALEQVLDESFDQTEDAGLIVMEGDIVRLASCPGGADAAPDIVGVPPAPTPENDLATIAALTPTRLSDLAATALTDFGCRVESNGFDAFEAFTMPRVALSVGVTLEGDDTPVYEALFDAMGDGFDLLDEQGRLTEADDGAMVLTGCAAASIPPGSDPLATLQAVDDSVYREVLTETIRGMGCAVELDNAYEVEALFYARLTEVTGVVFTPDDAATDYVDGRMETIAQAMLSEGVIIEGPNTVTLANCAAPDTAAPAPDVAPIEAVKTLIR